METGATDQPEESVSGLCKKPSSSDPDSKQNAEEIRGESESRLEPTQDDKMETSASDSERKTTSESDKVIKNATGAKDSVEKACSESEECPVESTDGRKVDEEEEEEKRVEGQELESDKSSGFAHVNVEQSEASVAEGSPKNALAETEIEEMEMDNVEVQVLDTTKSSEAGVTSQETSLSDKNQVDSNERDKKVGEESKDNDTEFVQISQDKNDDVQIEGHSMDAEDPFGGDSMQGNETLEQSEKEAEAMKNTLEQLGNQADNLQHVVDAQEDSACSSPKLAKSPEGEKSSEEKSESTETDKTATKEMCKKADDSVVQVVAGQDDELCIIPDSMKIVIPRKEDQGDDASANEVNEEKQVEEATNESEEILRQASSDDKAQSEEREDGSKSKVEGGEIEIVDDDVSTKGSDEIEEIGSNQMCKQCEKTTVCKFVAKVGVETYNVCSKTCKLAFQDDNNKSTDIPSDGVNSRKEKRCASCLLIVETGDEKNLSWETMEFCNEECLGKFQNKYGSYCRNCNGAVQPVSLGKYCVRFGYDVRQFCCSTCLEEFKKGLKVCSYCQKDISAETEGFLAPVGDKGQFKDFCTQDCMEKYSRMSSSEPVAPEKKPCGVCQEDKIVFCDVQIDRSAPVPICSEPCFAAFKFVNKVDPAQCSTCKKYYENSNKKNLVVFYEQDAHSFCSKTCLNVFIITNRKIVPCNWCKVKKYNFDMIKKELKIGQVIMMCSLNCLTLYQVSINAVSAKRIRCDYCKEFSQAQYHLTMSDATIRNFCSYNCVMNFQGQYSKSPITIPSPDDPVPTGLPKRTLPPTRAITQTLKPVEKKSLPVISSVTSLASMANGKAMVESPSPTTVTKSVSVQPITQMTGSKPQVIYKQQVIVRPPSPVKVNNRMTECKPITHTKGVYVRPRQSTVATQTDEDIKPVIPIPVPIYVPFPTHMYSMPFPVPVPIPIPIPVPIFIPTTRNTAKGIMKEMKKIQEQMPSDPFEAELLMMAEMVATEKKAESDSESADENRSDEEGEHTNAQHSSDTYSPENDANNAFEEDVLQMALKMASGEIEEPPVDLEAALATNTITPSRGQTNEPGANLENQAPIVRSVGGNRGKKRTTMFKTRGTPAKRGRKSSTVSDMSLVQQQGNQPAPPRFIEPVEKPDANMALKYTFGVNAWRQWVVAKNTEMDKQTTATTPAKKMKIKMDLLQLTADELNYSLCLFVKEVRKPNGQEYAPDTIYYLCLGIQQYLFENNRVDNIFTDPYYEKFTECLNDIAKKFASIYNEAQYIVTRVEEEHLWESKQLGAHSPHVLLNTLMYFNTKNFNLVSVEEHMQVSFAHIMKHWKRNPTTQQIAGNKTLGSRNILLRFYPPQSTLDANSKKKKMYEQQENEENPLRCPVKLYEFYLSKCPEIVKTRNDIFYLLPERSCVPDSPVWYSTSPLAKEQLIKMLYRIKMVKEINTALLNS